jgi:hypothetical protein
MMRVGQNRLKTDISVFSVVNNLAFSIFSGNCSIFLAFFARKPRFDNLQGKTSNFAIHFCSERSMRLSNFLLPVLAAALLKPSFIQADIVDPER